MATSSLLRGIDAVHVVAKGVDAIWLMSSAPLNPLYVESGLASLRYLERKANAHVRGVIWTTAATKGTGYSVRFKPSFVRSKRVQASMSQRSDGRYQLGAVLEDKSSCLGFTTFRNTAEITVPAILFNLRSGEDIWAFHFKSTQKQFSYHLDKTMLSASNESDQVLATMTGTGSGDLRVNVSMNGSGYVRSTLGLGRRFGDSFFRENLGEVKEPMATLNWKPITRNFDEILVCGDGMSFKEFRGFLERLGNTASNDEPKVSDDNFVVGDGPGIDYSLNLTAYRRLLSDDDTARFTLSEESAGASF